MAKKLWPIAAVTVAILLSAQPSHAQRLVFLDPTETIEGPRGEPGTSARLDRFRIGAHVAMWDLSLTSQLVHGGPTSPNSEPVPALNVEGDAGPLITFDYIVTRNFSVGGWWNRVTSDGGTVSFPTGRTDTGEVVRHIVRMKNIEADLFDIHGTYFFPSIRGLSVQAGVSTSYTSHRHVGRHTVGGVPTDFGAGDPEITNYDFTFTSPNIWLNYDRRLFNIPAGRRGIPVRFFGSVGYYTSEDFDNDWNVIVGGSIGLFRAISLDGSVWFNGLDDDSNTRVTVGLTGRF